MQAGVLRRFSGVENLEQGSQNGWLELHIGGA